MYKSISPKITKVIEDVVENDLSTLHVQETS